MTEKKVSSKGKQREGAENVENTRLFLLTFGWWRTSYKGTEMDRATTEKELQYPIRKGIDKKFL